MKNGDIVIFMANNTKSNYGIYGTGRVKLLKSCHNNYITIWGTKIIDISLNECVFILDTKLRLYYCSVTIGLSMYNINIKINATAVFRRYKKYIITYLRKLLYKI